MSDEATEPTPLDLRGPEVPAGEISVQGGSETYDMEPKETGLESHPQEAEEMEDEVEEAEAKKAETSLLSAATDDEVQQDHESVRSSTEDPIPSDADEDLGREAEERTPIAESEEQSLTPRPVSMSDEQEDDHGDDEHNDSADLSRKPSRRTEDLIHAAARKIVAQIERRNEQQEEQEEGPIDDQSLLSATSDGSYGQAPKEQTELSYTESSLLDNEQEGSYSSRPASIAPGEEEGESSSQHGGTDEDVFSDKSARSSVGSYDGDSESGSRKYQHPRLHHGEHDDNVSVSTRTPRISDISQYDREIEEFIPTARGTGPRPPFRTPSDVRALQMSSPPPSLFGSAVGSPRSSKRPFPTVSRLGSPAPSAQYSPKNRTPSRFKVKKEAPLVLLHATLLPLRWGWSDVMSSSLLEGSEMSEDARILRASWRVLQDHMGDTLAERGVLLGHPQNDYEVLEERILEALELPMRRRARILECGHYLGPTNEDSLIDDSDSEEDVYDAAESRHNGAHWCKTCKHDIRFESLGEGKIFRVKVYASNGLMKAGAWAACWKEMERVDVEIEPLVEAGLQEELARLAATLEEREKAQTQQMVEVDTSMQQEGDETDIVAVDDHDFSLTPDNHEQTQVQLPSSTVPEIAPSPQNQYRAIHKTPQGKMANNLLQNTLPQSATSAVDPVTGFHNPWRSTVRGEERRLRDEARMREIYGYTPEPSATEPTEHHGAHSDPFAPQPSAAEEVYERSETRRREAYQSDSLPELLLRSVRVLMRDRKNVVIFTLGFFVLLMALRNAPQQHKFEPGLYDRAVPQMQHQDIFREAPLPPVHMQQLAPEAGPVVDYDAQARDAQQATKAAPPDPCTTSIEVKHTQARVEPAAQESETRTEKRVVKVVETVTEFETQTETHKVKVTSTATEVVTPPEQSTEPIDASEVDGAFAGGMLAPEVEVVID